jgi:hypothetical protein
VRYLSNSYRVVVALHLFDLFNPQCNISYMCAALYGYLVFNLITLTRSATFPNTHGQPFTPCSFVQTLHIKFYVNVVQCICWMVLSRWKVHILKCERIEAINNIYPCQRMKHY